MHAIVTGKVQRREIKRFAKWGEIVFSAENAKLSDNWRIERIKNLHVLMQNCNMHCKVCILLQYKIVTCIARYVPISKITKYAQDTMKTL